MQEIIAKIFKFFHIPSFGDIAQSASSAAGKAAGQTVAEKASQITIPGLSGLHSASISPGTLFATLVVVAVLLLALTLGRTRTLISVLSIYVAFTLQTIFPFYSWLLKNESFTNDPPTLRVIVFLGLYAVVFGLLNRTVLKGRFNLSESSFLSVVLMGMVQLGLIISIILNLAPSFYNISHRLPAYLLPYIGNQLALFYWSLVPLFLLLFQKHSD